MGIRDDASLTARERAALANLEAKAVADDPQLAHRLRGGRRPSLDLRLPAVPTWSGSAWWSVPLIVIGVVLAVVGLSTALVLAVLGSMAIGAGLWMIAGTIERRLSNPPPSA